MLPLNALQGNVASDTNEGYSAPSSTIRDPQWHMLLRKCEANLDMDVYRVSEIITYV